RGRARAVQGGIDVRSIGRNARAIAELHGARVAGLVAPLAACAVAVDIAAAGGLAQQIRAARAGAANRGRVGSGTRAVIGVVAANAVRTITHAGAADGRLVGDGAGAAAVQLAALVVARVAHRRLANQATGGNGALAVQRGIGVRDIGGNGGAVGELCGAHVAGLVAPLIARAIRVHVATTRGAAQQVRAATPRTTHRGRGARRARAAVDGVATLVVGRFAHACLTHERAGGRTAVAIQGWIGMREVGRNRGAVAQFGRARMHARVAPIAAGAVRVHVAATHGLAKQIRAATPRTTHRGRGARRAGAAVDGVAILVVGRFAHACLTHERGYAVNGGPCSAGTAAT